MLEIAGFELLPNAPVFAAFVLAGLALNLVPGADMTFVIGTAARDGKRAGVIAALGIGAGTLAHILAAVLGLSALLASSPGLFEGLKWVGAAYLLYIAASFLRAPTQSLPQAPPTGGRLFRKAALVNLLNPKVALFFLAFLPQFVDPAARSPALQILCLGLWFNLVGTAVNAAVALASASAAERLSRIRWLARAARYAAATLLGGMAIKLAFASRA